MALIEKENRRIFLGIANGKITRKIQGQDEPKTYESIEGSLVGITRHTAVIKGVQTEFVSFILEDGGETYDVSSQTSGGITRGIILCLASVQNFVGNKVKIKPYLSKDGQHTNTAVFVNGQKTSWVTKEIPAAKEVQVGSAIVKDDSERLKFVNRYIELVQQRLAMATATPQSMAEENEDLPGDDDTSDTSWMGNAEHM